MNVHVLMVPFVLVLKRVHLLAMFCLIWTENSSSEMGSFLSVFLLFSLSIKLGIQLKPNFFLSDLQLETELRAQQAQASAVNLEKMKLEEVRMP